MTDLPTAPQPQRAHGAPGDDRAFDPFGCALRGSHLIEASAGTGKTWTLSLLVLRVLLESAQPISRILVVTFTQAAAAELRERIRDRIRDTLQWLRAPSRPDQPLTSRLIEGARDRGKCDDERLARLLEAALANFDEAAILTIHGFCQRALAQMPFAAGVPFELGHVTDDSELYREVATDHWRTMLAHRAWPEALVRRWLAARDDPSSWSALLARRRAKPLADIVWPVNIGQAGVDRVEAAQRQLDLAYERMRSGGAADLSDAKARLDAAGDVLYTRYYGAGQNIEIITAWSSYLSDGDPLAVDDRDPGRLRALRASVITARTGKNKPVPSHPVFDLAEAVMAAWDALRGQVELLRLWLLREFLERADERIARRKSELRTQSYDDMLRSLHEALAGGDGARLANALAARYPVAMIDEFQDTDPLQYGIFERIYGGKDGPWFMVGDPKQAIYGFRNADLHVYLAARARVGFTHTLTSNQRAVAPLVDACNRLFGARSGAFLLPGLHFSPAEVGEKARAHLTDDGDATAAAMTVWMLGDRPGGSPVAGAPVDAGVAAAVAAEIARLLADARVARARIDQRPLAPADIAVLVRSHAHGRLIAGALREIGVGSVELSQRSVHATIDAIELERVLRAVIEPTRQGLLLAALSTELIGMTAVDIDRLSTDEVRLFERMTRMSQYRDLWVGRGFGPMLRRWLADDQVAQRLLPRPDGERRLTNLLHLAEILHEASETHRAPEALLRWFARQREITPIPDGEQLRLESDANLVNIVTIHRSKGLEYPVVFCPFLWRMRGQSGGSGAAVEYYGDDGRLVIDLDPGAKDDDAVMQRRRREAAAEDMRLIYVALTRASHRCYLVVDTVGHDGRSKPSTALRSPLNWLLFPTADDYPEWAVDKKRVIDGEQVTDAWRRYARDAGVAAVALRALPVGRPALSAAPAPAASGFEVPLPPRVHPGWRIGSFSMLIQQRSPEAVAADHDADEAFAGLFAADRSPVGGETPEIIHAAAAGDSIGLPAFVGGSGDEPGGGGPMQTDILLFPRGAVAGDCVHAMFERADFTDRDGWPHAIRRALDEFPPASPGDARAPARPVLEAMLTGLLADVLRTSIGESLALVEIGRGDRLTELGFQMNVGRLRRNDLDTWLATHGYGAPGLGFTDFRGYLTGFIDLVFRHHGRYYLLDWKSNHLGMRAGDYTRPVLERAMVEHGYCLQYLIYATALRRWLRARFGGSLPAARIDDLFGGVYYLFVRGVRPHWRDREGRPTGVFFDRPDDARLDSFDRLLRAGEP